MRKYAGEPADNLDARALLPPSVRWGNGSPIKDLTLGAIWEYCEAQIRRGVFLSARDPVSVTCDGVTM
jgi:hypothetical protein